MPESATVSVDDMRACLGSLMLLWADIERELREEVARQRGTDPKPAHGTAACLRDWRNSIPDTNDVGQIRGELADSLIRRFQHVLAIRNGLCHGLIGYTSGSERSAHLLWRLNDQNGRVSYKELQEWFAWLASVPRAISMLSELPVQGRPNRCVDTAANRQWWETEFALGIQPDETRLIGQ